MINLHLADIDILEVGNVNGARASCPHYGPQASGLHIPKLLFAD
jgi:hypothetical protein